MQGDSVGYKGKFVVTGARGASVYELHITSNGSSEEHYSCISPKELLRQADRHKNFRPEFHCCGGGIQQDVRRKLLH